MQKIAWSVLLVAVIGAAGGAAYYVIQHQTAEVTHPVTPPNTDPPQPTAKSPDEDLTKRKLEGIGSTRELKPVQIPQGNAR